MVSLNFNYTFKMDLDNINHFSQYRTTVLEDVHMTTHELNINWALGDDIEVTSGVFFMDELRQQDYSLSNTPLYHSSCKLRFPRHSIGNSNSLQAFLGFDPSVMALLGWPNDALAPQVSW